jgi:hypothetical protein
MLEYALSIVRRILGNGMTTHFFSFERHVSNDEFISKYGSLRRSSQLLDLKSRLIATNIPSMGWKQISVTFRDGSDVDLLFEKGVLSHFNTMPGLLHRGFPYGSDGSRVRKRIHTTINSFVSVGALEIVFKKLLQARTFRIVSQLAGAK